MSNTHHKTIVLIMAGATGGHIFPALAIASKLKKTAINVQWLGSNHGMENTLIPKHNIKLHTVSAVGLRGKRLLSLIKAPFLLSLALFQTISIVVKIKPNVVLGMGGFTSGIGGVVAWLLRIPLVIHEQNAIAGTTNKLLNKIATQTFQAFSGAFAQNSKNCITSGNPVLFTPIKKTQNNGKLNLLIIGGSLGSKPINDVAVQLRLDVNIWHQTGKANLADVKSQYQSHHQDNLPKITAFIDDMARAYAWADVVVCRAGAMSVSELMLSATASILVPLPHAIDNHQFYNAKILSNNAAGILIEQKYLTPQLLEQTINNLNKTKIEQMSANALKLAKPNAANQIAKYLRKM